MKRYRQSFAVSSAGGGHFQGPVAIGLGRVSWSSQRARGSSSMDAPSWPDAADLQIGLRTRIFRSTALIALSAAGLLGPSVAFGQESVDEGSAPQEIVITGTSIVRDGFSAPTPVTVVGMERLESSATSNIADYVNTIPVFSGSQTPISGYHNSSNAAAGVNTLNLRNIGSSRTLVLIDGQRSVGSGVAGLVDVNNIPQDLVTRVDIVTGGASAVYGSDALSGVVNFVLNKSFTGTKAELSGGGTTHGDGYNWKASLTHGFSFLGGRGHFIASGELTKDYGIHGVPRDWNDAGQAIINNPAYTPTNGAPQLIRVSQASLYTATWGGIITNTALANTTFGPGGIPSQFHLGSIVSNPYTVGGDWASNQSNTLQSLTPEERSARIFVRASYDITDNINIFGQFSWAQSKSLGYNEPNFYLGNLVVQSDNAFIPDAIAEKLKSLDIKQFNMGTLNGDLPDWGNDASRITRRYVVGASGDFDVLKSNWTWNVYFQRGEMDSKFQAVGVSNRQRYMLAIDAVRDPVTNAIICRSSLADPTNGCVPYNLFGTGVNSQAAINYIEPSSPTQDMALRQDVWAGSLSGEPLSNWAGPISLAASVVHRRESVTATADAMSGSWFAANYSPINGSYSVTEGALETVVPLAKDAAWAKALDLNAAVRLTDYSTSGAVVTWKIGATWDVTPDIRLRATRSRDIRAPNLGELFQAGAGGTGQIQDHFRDGDPVLYRIVQSGGIGLKPEKADAIGLGVVLQPSFMRGFSASADYWRINISGAIGTIGSQQRFDFCFQGLKDYCKFILPDPSAITVAPASYDIINSPVNLASQKVSGIDFEAGYKLNLADVVQGWAGAIDLRYLGTYNITNITDNRVSPPNETAGRTLPAWRHNITAAYSADKFRLSLTARGLSGGTMDSSYVECASGCPVSTLSNPTIDNAHRPGAFFFDASTSYNFTVGDRGGFQVYLNVRNLFDKDPPIVPLPPTGVPPYFSLQTFPELYDVLGRTVRLGIRLNM
ncbi:MAG TPA: TonB-dependent receptor [Sphingobium sp.]|nr:TonB-dependent receptor [Sphingobium sp.]